MKHFEKNKNASELGIDPRRMFVVVRKKDSDASYKVGDILKINQINEKHNCYMPAFNNITNGRNQIYCYWEELYYADEHKFKVGDKCKVIKCLDINKTEYLHSRPTGNIITIVGYTDILDKMLYRCSDSYNRFDEELELVEEASEYKPSEIMNKIILGVAKVESACEDRQFCDMVMPYLVLEVLKNKFKPMENIIKFAKNLVLSEDEKLLRKYGIKNDCGEYTEVAASLVTEKLLKDNEAYLIDIAKKKEEEDKK